MRCPNCGSLDDKVLESRTMVNGEAIRRRRECVSCGYRFTSYERIDETPFMVVKRNNVRQPFDKSKLEKGLQRALVKRPFSTNQLEQLVTDIEDQAVHRGRETREITTAELGELVLKKLYETDKVAYIRFASVYKHFENLDEFIKEVQNIEENKNF